MTRHLALAATLFAVIAAAPAADWHQYRGPNGDGTTDEKILTTPVTIRELAASPETFEHKFDIADSPGSRSHSSSASVPAANSLARPRPPARPTAFS